MHARLQGAAQGGPSDLPSAECAGQAAVHARAEGNTWVRPPHHPSNHAWAVGRRGSVDVR
jgi:hypothetical protein